jgi:hypothetical protein
MKQHLVWGFVLALASAALTLILYLAGFQTEKLEVGQFLQWLGFPVMIAILALGGRAIAAARAPEATSYGRALGSLLLITLFGGLFAGVYNVIHFQFINPEFPTYVNELTEKRLESMNVPAEQIEAALSIQEAVLTPPVQGLMAFGGTLLFGLIFSLVIAVFVKRPAAASPPPLA